MEEKRPAEQRQNALVIFTSNFGKRGYVNLQSDVAIAQRQFGYISMVACWTRAGQLPAESTIDYPRRLRSDDEEALVT